MPTALEAVGPGVAEPTNEAVDSLSKDVLLSFAMPTVLEAVGSGVAEPTKEAVYSLWP